MRAWADDLQEAWTWSEADAVDAFDADEGRGGLDWEWISEDEGLDADAYADAEGVGEIAPALIAPAVLAAAPAVLAAAPAILGAIQAALPALARLVGGLVAREQAEAERLGWSEGSAELAEASLAGLEAVLGRPTARVEAREAAEIAPLIPAIIGLVTALAPVAQQVIQGISNRRPAPRRPAPAPARPSPVPVGPSPVPMAPAPVPMAPSPTGADPMVQLAQVLPLLTQLAGQLQQAGPPDPAPAFPMMTPG